ncbi:hypothetical protein FOQG_12915 [Fusarium oxysporum f. sp. raphani 54005]|uniref:Apple domain-containing protein n=2 Tax=Fusarium oxysporum f. sp. raphani TaxID=96318 RepID=X0BWC0_FUSOX|nr:hypothetical protein FOQG_12915 [Fusarium oxysporum f. sp. raphani 54005]KAG7425064.1 hypothetical protein Forpi1262_v014019 [Fusarium oxysporum f. sp. raphani]KAJ4094210.1 hypothetical protein NW769_012279 [Fusarium oxysporum]KAJ4215220.1 hypothetical protein NW760_014350 [Fusarium oxysporum]
MRSILALAALAAVDFVAGSACKPKSSNTIPTLVSSSTDATSSSTATSVVTLPKVRNLAANGNMAEVDPNNPLSVPGWEVDGDARIVGGAGREEPGSTERGCAAMSASNNGDGKRALGISVSISQSMSNLDLSTPYTIRFYYLVVTSPAAINLCQLTGFLGGSVFYQNWVFSTGTAVSWNEVLQAVTPAQVNAPLRIAMNCLIGGGATVLVDSVFISNAVTPQNINDFAVNFGNTGTGANPPLDPPVVGPQTTTSSSQQETTSATQAPETTSATQKQETTSVSQKQETTSVPQKQETTSAAQEQGTTSASQKPETTSAPQKQDTTSVSQKQETSLASQEPETTSAAPVQPTETGTTGQQNQATSTQPASQQTSTGNSDVETTSKPVSEAQSSTVPVVGTTSTAPEQPFCSKALNGGCWWKRPDNGNDMVNCASRGSWPGSTGQGRLVPRPDNYPLPLSQLWCLGWCSLSPGCKSVAFIPEDRSCRFSEHQVQDADFVPGPDPNLDTEGVFYWHDLSCFNCPCNDEPSPTSVASTTQSAEPTDLVKLPAASTCPKSLENGCQWNERSQGGSLTSCQYRGRWPGSDGAGFAVEQPRDYPTAWSQMWCVAWCSLYPGCKSAAWMPSDRSCRFSTHQVSDADFVMAADPNSDSVEDGIYYWHDLDCMTCPCHDDPTSDTISSLPAESTTLTRAVTPKPNTPTTVTATTKAVTGTPTPGPVEQPCDWSFGQGICQRPFEKEQGPCAGKLMIVNPSQYTKLPLNWKPEITEPVQCAIMCHTNPDCYAWGFEWSSNMNCVLSLGQTEVDQLEVVSSGAQYRWYSHTCWECRDCVTQWNWSWDSLPAGN